MTITAEHAAPLDLAAYKSLENDELSARIEAVRARLGSRLLILGHHYQQDEVIAHWRPARRQLPAQPNGGRAVDACRAIVFCGVHFMAETADILANRPEKLAERGRPAGDGGPARHGRRLLDGRHGGDRAGRRRLGGPGRGDRHGGHHAGHLHQLGRQPEGLLRAPRRHRLHVQQRRRGA